MNSFINEFVVPLCLLLNVASLGRHESLQDIFIETEFLLIKLPFSLLDALFFYYLFTELLGKESLVCRFSDSDHALFVILESNRIIFRSHSIMLLQIKTFLGRVCLNSLFISIIHFYKLLFSSSSPNVFRIKSSLESAKTIRVNTAHSLIESILVFNRFLIDKLIEFLPCFYHLKFLLLLFLPSLLVLFMFL